MNNSLIQLLKEPLSGWRYLLYFISLMFISIGFGFALMYLSYDTEMWTLMQDQEFMKKDNTFKIAAMVLMPLFFYIDIRRVNSFMKHLGKTFLIVLAVFALTSPFQLFGVEDTYHISKIVSIPYIIWLIFFNAQKKEVDSI